MISRTWEPEYMYFLLFLHFMNFQLKLEYLINVSHYVKMMHCGQSLECDLFYITFNILNKLADGNLIHWFYKLL